MIGDPAIDRLIRIFAKLPGLGPRSAQRTVLALLGRKDTLMRELAATLEVCARTITKCGRCGNLASSDPCPICADPARDPRVLLVVEDIEDLWAMERGGGFKGLYHVLGGTLSALDSIGPHELGVDRLIARVASGEVEEVVLALGATVDGQTTSHYLAERLANTGIAVTRLAQGVPVGGEIHYLDEGTLSAAYLARRPIG